MKLKWHMLPLCIWVTFAPIVQSVNDIEITQPQVWFSGTLGGVSHTAWVLEILEVVRRRGYNVSYVSFEANRKYLGNYLDIHFIPLREVSTHVQFRDMFEVDEGLTSSKALKAVTQYYKAALPQQLLEYTNLLKKGQPALVICDHLNFACSSAAHKLKIPLAISATVYLNNEPPDFFMDMDYIDSDVTTRPFGSNVVTSIKYLAYRLSVIRNIAPLVIFFESLGRRLQIPRFKWAAKNSGAVQIINQMFPLEKAHVLDPAEHYIGPIFISQYQPLTEKLETYLNSHNKVVYIAFGQMYVPKQEEFNAIVLGLLDNYRQGIIDGFIWARVGLPTSMISTFESNHTINTSGFAKNPDFLFEKWVPQYSILNHTSTKLFISHAGTGSTHEAVFNGVPILAHPFSSDQPSNAIQLEKAGVALINNRKTCTAESISRKIKTILKDRQQEFIAKANELRTFAHIAKRRKELAADILEQQLLCSREGKAWYYEQEDDYWYLFMPSWRKIVISLVSLKVAPYFFGALRKYMSKMLYKRITQGPKVVYSKSKKL